MNRRSFKALFLMAGFLALTVGSCGGDDGNGGISLSNMCERSCNQSESCDEADFDETFDSISECVSECTEFNQEGQEDVSQSCGAASLQLNSCIASLSCDDLEEFQEGEMMGLLDYPCKDDVDNFLDDCEDELQSNSLRGIPSGLRPF